MKNLPISRGIWSFILMSICMFMFTLNVEASTQQGAKVQINGTVVDKTGEPVIGASVLEKGTTNGTVTNVDGKFTLKVSPKATVTVSYIGYKSQSFTVGSNHNFNITLEDDSEMLNEVVVVGYGTVRKADLAGSVAVMDNKSFKDQPVTRVTDALQGRVAGVQVENSGAPGGAIKVRVRGSNSVQLNNEPLYVVDGVVRQSGLDGLNPDDIKSIQVLKDASSTAIYGSRGANGVVLVTTKTGVSGQRIISFDAQVGVANIYKKYDVLSPIEYADAWLHWNPGTITDERLNALRTGKAGIDWQDEIFRTGVTQDYKLAVSNGNDKTQYYISANYMKQTGALRFADYTRYSARANVTSDVTDWLNVNADIQFNHGVSHGPDFRAAKGNIIYNALNYSPIIDMKTADGHYNDIDAHNTGGNPIGGLMTGDNEGLSYNAIGNLSLKFNIVKGLTFTTTNAFDYADNKGYGFGSSLASPNGSSSVNNHDNQRLMLQTTNNLTYFNQFGDHTITATGVWEATDTEWRQLGVEGKQLSPESVGYWNVQVAKNTNPNNNYMRETLLSGVGRFIYNYANRYTLTATFRADGSSKFLNKKWGYFPSIAAAWDISNEPFMKNFNAVQGMKLRASYGVIGNQAIGAYSSLGLLASQWTNLGTEGEKFYGYTLGTPASPDLTWEKTKQFDLGFEFSVLDRRLAFSLDYFNKKTTDCLMNEPLPLYNGGGSVVKNIGQVNNWGFDASVTARIFQEKDFSWTSTLNATYLKNEVKNIGSNPRIFGNSPAEKMADESNIVLPGYAIGSFYGYVWEGIDDKGANIYKDLNGDKKIDGADRKVIGKSTPDFTFGWNNQLSYKNWELNCFLTGSFGLKKLNLVRYAMASSISDADFINLKEGYTKNWDIVANKADAEFASYKNGGTNYANSTQWLENANFVRLSNLSLSYKLGRDITKFADLRLTLSCQNLFTITGYKGMDPASSAFSRGNVDVVNGVDMGGYPTPRTFTFGVKMNF